MNETLLALPPDWPARAAGCLLRICSLDGMKHPKPILQQLGDESNILDYIFNYRYKNQKTCSFCNQPFHYRRVRNKTKYSCAWCLNKISPLVGTALENTNVSVSLWIKMVAKLSTAKQGVSIMDLHRFIGSRSRKTTSRLFYKILACLGKELPETLTSPYCEIDEVFIGGLSKNNLYRPRTRKKTVMVMVERGVNNRAIAVHVRDKSSESLIPQILKFIPNREINVITDENPSYSCLSTDYGYEKHRTILHKASKKRFVKDGFVSTNTAENFNAKIKSFLKKHKLVSSKRLQLYLNWISFQFNHRHSKTHVFYHMLHALIKDQK